MYMHRYLLVSLLLLSTTMQDVHALENPEQGFYTEDMAGVWEEYLVTGNGTMGTMIAGYPYNEHIVVNHSELFLPIHEPLIPPSQGAHIDTMRRMILAGNYQGAADLLVDISHDEGFGVKRQSDLFIPAFQIDMTSDSSDVQRYHRQTDFRTAEVAVEWGSSVGTFVRRTFVSRADNVIVMEYSSAGSTVDVDIELNMVRTFETKRKVKFALDDDFNIANVEKEATDGWLTIRAWYAKPWHGGYQGYEGVVKVIADGGSIAAEKGVLKVRGAGTLTLFCRVAPSKDMSSPSLSEMKEGMDLLSTSYDDLLCAHTSMHGDLFNRVKLRLNGNDDIVRLFDAARYNIICSTGINPPNLQGIWGATMTPPWAGDYTTNGNLPAAVSHLLDCSTPELMLPLFDKLEALMPHFRTNAQVLFNSSGIHIPSHICLHGYDNQFDATWPMTFWTAGAAWYSMIYYDYYLHTLDDDFLRSRAYPFMVEAAKFYDDFLTKDDEGHFIFNPSYSPENHPRNSASQACINATMDIMAAKGLYRDLIDAAAVLGEDGSHWKDMLAAMPPYLLNDDGELREWMWGGLSDNHRHRHASHLLGLFYQSDDEIMADSSLRDGCRKVIEQRLAYRKSSKDGGVMAFGVAQLAFAASALGYTDLADELLHYAMENYWNSNYMTTHDSHKIFNADMSGAFPQMVVKMLVYSERGQVSLLPACPWKKGTVEGLSLRGGISIPSLSWDGDSITVTLLSPINQPIVLYVRGTYAKTINLKADVPMIINL